MPPAPARRVPVTVHAEGGAVVLQVAELLDSGTGDALLAATQAALDAHPDRVEIDLRALRSWTQDGARALVRCRSLCGELADGLHYRTGRGPGRDALLAAYT